MKLTLAKDWSKHKAGDEVEVNDPAVIKKGIETGLFTEGESSDQQTGNETKSKKQNKKEK